MSIQKPIDTLFGIVAGVMVYPALQVAIKLNIPDLLMNSALSVADLASRTQSHPDSLYRLMRFLAAAGVFEEVQDSEDHVFANNEVSHLLCKNVPNSMARYMAREIYPEWANRVLQNLPYTIRTGEPAFDHAYGLSIWDCLQQNPAARQDFDETMTIISETFTECTLAEYDFSGLNVIADIGGSYGSLLIAVLRANPHAKGILFDRPEVIAEAANMLPQTTDNDIMQRCQLQSGDFSKTVPSDCDIYLLRYILHNWGDDVCVRILKNCRSASPKARVLIVEQVLQPDRPDRYTLVMDFWMLASFRNAKERTQQEYSALFKAAGYRLAQVIPTTSPVSIVEAIPED
ncbi:MAG: methyltransferase [Thiotrichaceae bacterium]